MVFRAIAADHVFVKTRNVLVSDDTQLSVFPGCALFGNWFPAMALNSHTMKNLVLFVSIVCYPIVNNTNLILA